MRATHEDFVVELYKNTTPWKDVRGDILAIEKAAFGNKADSEENLRGCFENSRATAVFIRNRIGKIVGYTYAIPNFEDDLDTDAHVDSVALLPEYQGRGLVAKLNQRLEEELIKKGYGFITLHAGLASGYAGKIEKNYAGRIVESYDMVSKYGYGPQRYFRIKLV